MNGLETVRYHCKFGGCDKSFQRKEHLIRHAQAHSESRYVCEVCQKKFIRNDSLQRHLGLHGKAFRPSPAGQSKRACVKCRLSKLKCDGKQPCSRCHKKFVACHYDSLDPESQKEASSKSKPTLVSPGDQESYESNGDNYPATSGEKVVERSISFEERIVAALNRNKGPIDWTAVRVQNDTPPSPGFRNLSYREDRSTPNANAWPALSKSDTAKFAKLYFAHFHHRWPVLHAPSFDEDTAPPVLLSCVIMIGAFIHGTSISKELALNFQRPVLDHVSLELGQLSSEGSIDSALIFALCQASLLYIIFGLYCGKDTILSKSIMVRSLLVTSLREMGLFNPELPSPYDKPGYFMPFRLVKEAQTQRLFTCLLKIDSYLSILRNEPTLLTPEELHFTLPATFALWNANGLKIFENRYSIEPRGRSQTTIYRTICDPISESFTPTDGLLLIEDIQLGICAMHSKVWYLRKKIQNYPDQDISNAIETGALQRQLNTWKYWINQNPIQHTDHIDFSREQHLAMRFYYGMEDHSDPGWQLIVFDRPKNLIFDTLMLYHLLSMHLSADVRMLTQLAKDNDPTNAVRGSGEIYLKDKERRKRTIRKWAESASVRQALCHATDLLVSYNNLSGLENNSVDPIAFVALSVGALVVWAFSMYGGKGCSDCVSENTNIPFIATSIIELTKWSGRKTSQVFDKDRKTWVEMGGCRVTISGLPLCRCHIGSLMAKFRSCIRQDWDIVDTIAPGIFKLSS